MNPETTVAVSRAELARRASEALDRVAGAAERRLERHAGGFGLSDAKLEVLEVLSCCDDRRACLHALGDELGVTRPNVTKLVDGLERGGLVERLPHPSDRRMVQAHVTRQGLRVAQWREMIDDKEQKISRPRQVYTGAEERDYVPMESR